MEIEQYSVFWIDLGSTKGGEMKKLRPCVTLSPTEANRHFVTIIVAPITNTNLGLPTRCQINVDDVSGYVALDQMRALDKSRFRKKVDNLGDESVKTIKNMIREFLVD
jgi:mRNA interferase MazF